MKWFMLLGASVASMDEQAKDKDNWLFKFELARSSCCSNTVLGCISGEILHEQKTIAATTMTTTTTTINKF